jgi:predicted DNA-binding protein (MmcQ/YjbR family)
MMTRDEIKRYMLNQKASEETFPFGEQVSVFKVLGKMYALLNFDDPVNISLKCDPDFARVLRDTYEAIEPGYHLNKRHWNTVTIDGTIADDEILEMIDESYKLVVMKMTKKDQKKLDEL